MWHTAQRLSVLNVSRQQKSPVLTVTVALTWRSTDIQNGCRSLGKQEVGGWGWGFRVQETTAGWQSQMSKQKLCDSAIYYGISRHCCYCCRQRKENRGEVCVCVCVCMGLFKNKVEKGKKKERWGESPQLEQTLKLIIKHTPWHTWCTHGSHTWTHTHADAVFPTSDRWERKWKYITGVEPSATFVSSLVKCDSSKSLYFIWKWRGIMNWKQGQLTECLQSKHCTQLLATKGRKSTAGVCAWAQLSHRLILREQIILCVRKRVYVCGMFINVVGT